MKWLEKFIASVTSTGRRVAELEGKLLQAAGEIDLLNLQIRMKNEAIKKMRSDLLDARFNSKQFEAGYERGHLIAFHVMGTATQYAQLVSYEGAPAWIQDSTRATRFSRKVDALNALEFLRVNKMAPADHLMGEPYRVEEHMFATQSKPTGNPRVTAPVPGMNPGLYPQQETPTDFGTLETPRRRWVDDLGKPVFGTMYPGDK